MEKETKHLKAKKSTQIPSGSKLCTQCAKLMDYEFFYKNKSKKDGYESYCKSCAKKNRKKKKVKLEKNEEFEVYFTLPDERIFIERLKPLIEEIINE